MRRLIIIALILSSINCAFGQEKSRTYSKWHLKPAAGINTPITTLLSGEITDNLFEYDDYSFYLQFISGSYFFSQNWGVEMNIQFNFSRNISRRLDRFNAQIQSEYGDDYFVNPNSTAWYYDEDILTGSFPRMYLGLVYRIEIPKYILLPKLFIGLTGVYPDRGSAYLKEKGSHTTLELSYKQDKKSGDQFTIAPGISFGYRLSKRFVVNFDLLYSYFKTDFEFIKETRNTFTEEVWAETIDYKKDIHTVSMGVGLIIELNLEKR